MADQSGSRLPSYGACCWIPAFAEMTADDFERNDFCKSGRNCPGDVGYCTGYWLTDRRPRSAVPSLLSRKRVYKLFGVAFLIFEIAFFGGRRKSCAALVRFSAQCRHPKTQA